MIFNKNEELELYVRLLIKKPYNDNECIIQLQRLLHNNVGFDEIDKYVIKRAFELFS